MKKRLVVLSLVLIAIALLTNCQNNNDKTNSSKEMKIDKVLLQYKGSFVGNNSAIMNILWNVPGGNYVKEINLQTKKPPFGIGIIYGLKGDPAIKEKDFYKYWNDENTKKVFLNSATTLFILIKNVTTVTITLDTPIKSSFSITRKDMEDFYGRDLKEYANDTSLWEKEVLKGTINSNKKIDEFFNRHNITNSQ